MSLSGLVKYGDILACPEGQPLEHEAIEFATSFCPHQHQQHLQQQQQQQQHHQFSLRTKPNSEATK
jgi:hypothetical protein